MHPGFISTTTLFIIYIGVDRQVSATDIQSFNRNGQLLPGFSFKNTFYLALFAFIAVSPFDRFEISRYLSLSKKPGFVDISLPENEAVD